jgi:HNH endonuclease
MRAFSIRPKAKLIRENLRAVKQLYFDVTSQSGEDSEENLITLCAVCHARVHYR